MKDKDSFNINIKLVSISLKLNKLNSENIFNNALILGINNTNLNKKELIKLIIEHLKKLKLKELEEFQKQLMINLDEKNTNNDNRNINNIIKKNHIEIESDIDTINQNFNKIIYQIVLQNRLKKGIISFKDDNILKTNDNILNNNILLNNYENDINEINENTSENDEDSEKVIDNTNNLFIMDNLNENKDLCFNIQKCINIFDLMN